MIDNSGDPEFSSNRTHVSVSKICIAKRIDASFAGSPSMVKRNDQPCLLKHLNKTRRSTTIYRCIAYIRCNEVCTHKLEVNTNRSGGFGGDAKGVPAPPPTSVRNYSCRVCHRALYNFGTRGFLALNVTSILRILIHDEQTDTRKKNFLGRTRTSCMLLYR